MDNHAARKAGWVRKQKVDDSLQGQINRVSKRIHNRDVAFMITLAFAVWLWALVEAYR